MVFEFHFASVSADVKVGVALSQHEFLRGSLWSFPKLSIVLVLLMLDQRLVDCSPRTRSGPLPAFVNKVLLKQPRALVYTLSMASFTLEWQS